MKCEICQKEVKGLKMHIWKAHGPGVHHNPRKNTVPWNKGKTKETDFRCARPEKLGVKFGASLTGHSKETKERLSEIMSKKMLNRYTASKREEYNGVKFESSWEVELAKNLDENDIKWIRPAPLIYADANGQKRRYYPDFYLPDFDLYLDPKNPYVQRLDREKFDLVIEQNKIKLYMLSKNQLDWKVIKSEVLR